VRPIDKALHAARIDSNETNVPVGRAKRLQRTDLTRLDLPYDSQLSSWDRAVVAARGRLEERGTSDGQVSAGRRSASESSTIIPCSGLA
jgi:hypothetical protein